jgi:hypothetical protein
MVRGHSTAGQRRRGAIGALGTWLAAVALTLQALLPLADARWHAQGHGAGGRAAAASAHGLRTAPLTPSPQPASTDQACQLCIGLQTAAGPAPSETPAPAAPAAYRTIVRAPVVLAAPPQRPATPHQPRGPPLQA